MNIAIRYYSRGGNTQKLAKAIEEAVGLQAQTVAAPLEESVDILFLGCSYYAFDMDRAVKQFISDNQDKIGKIVLFGTSAMMKSMKKPLGKVLKDANTSIAIADEEFHCPGSFGPMHRERPNSNDLEAAKNFAKRLIKS